MIRFSAAAALATLAIFSVTTSWGAEQTAQKKPPAKVSSTEAQKSTASGSKRPLVLSGSVPLEGVKGRFDHFAFGQGRVFVSALGNNTVEVINVFGGIVEHTITGVPNPRAWRSLRKPTNSSSPAQKGRCTSTTQDPTT